MSVVVDGKATSPLKRQRSESSSEGSPGTAYQSTPGSARYEKDRLVCDQCGLGFRKHSDLKKHNARHSRSYRCVEEGCPRSQIGFATINDLYRHEKSVHAKHVGKSRMYRCFAPGCAKASKLWPRLDNFKQHLIRMHPSEDVDVLVKKSEQWHAEEEGDGPMSQLSDGHSQESVISSLQNVKRLRSPPRPLNGPSRAESDSIISRRWDLTPPTTATTQERRSDLRQILTDPRGPSQSHSQPPSQNLSQSQPQSNGERRLEPTPTPTPTTMHPPPPPPSQSQSQSQPPPHHSPPSLSSPPSHHSPPPPPPPPTTSAQSQPHLQPHPLPDPIHRLSPDDLKPLSRPASTVRELSTEARCRSCVWNNRRCYVDQSNPRNCVSCRSREECIFRRTVIRDAPADFFTWSELVGLEHLPVPPLGVQGAGGGGGGVGGGGA